MIRIKWPHQQVVPVNQADKSGTLPELVEALVRRHQLARVLHL